VRGDEVYKLFFRVAPYSSNGKLFQTSERFHSLEKIGRCQFKVFKSSFLGIGRVRDELH
jgi:hypothetical protein